MPKLVVLDPPPADVAAFESSTHSEHAPMVVWKIHGLTKFVAAHVLGTPAGAAPYQRVAERTRLDRIIASGNRLTRWLGHGGPRRGNLGPVVRLWS